MEDSVANHIPAIMEDEPATRFELIVGGSVKGGDLLADNWGYAYTRKRTIGKVTTWTCSSRGKKCAATIKQLPDSFVKGLHSHNHPCDYQKTVCAKARAMVKVAARNDISKGTGAVVSETLRTLPEDAPLLHVGNLQRSANRVREALRPKHPQDLDFELEASHIPYQFLQKHLRLDGQCHLIFGSSLQMAYLANARVWFVDGTSKFVRDPFVRLLSIQSFVRSNGAIKQVPLCFILMSRHKKCDYKAVFDALLELLPADPSVEEVVLDFEKEVWSVLQQCLPDTSLHGCWFHWTHTVYRKVKEYGLREAYVNLSPVQVFIRELMGLPNLPAMDIEAAFYQLKAHCPVTANTDNLCKLVDYIEVTWITSSTHGPESWCTYNRTVRNNEDVMGWHQRLKRSARMDHPNLYILISLLHKETSLMPLRVRLITQGQLYVAKNESEPKQKSLQQLWRQYEKQDIEKSLFLQNCALLADHPEE